jgi:hypothetical protein
MRRGDLHLKQSGRTRKFESKKSRTIGVKQMRQASLLELARGRQRCAAVVGSDKHKKIAVVSTSFASCAVFTPVNL